MRTKTERATGVTLRLLNVAGIADAALEKYNQHRALDDEKPATAMRVGWAPYGVLEKDDKVYVINNEGVGWEITDAAPLEIDLYPEWGSSFSIAPAMQASLNRAEVLERVIDETVDLSEHIRSFGARLESNFWTWHRLATA